MIDPLDAEDIARRGDKDTVTHEGKLEKMSSKELIEKYGMGIVPPWGLKRFMKRYPHWKKWDDKYREVKSVKNKESN